MSAFILRKPGGGSYLRHGDYLRGPNAHRVIRGFLQAGGVRSAIVSASQRSALVEPVAQWSATLAIARRSARVVADPQRFATVVPA